MSGAAVANWAALGIDQVGNGILAGDAAVNVPDQQARTKASLLPSGIETSWLAVFKQEIFIARGISARMQTNEIIALLGRVQRDGISALQQGIREGPAQPLFGERAGVKRRRAALVSAVQPITHQIHKADAGGGPEGIIQIKHAQAVAVFVSAQTHPADAARGIQLGAESVVIETLPPAGNKLLVQAGICQAVSSGFQRAVRVAGIAVINAGKDYHQILDHTVGSIGGKVKTGAFQGLERIAHHATVIMRESGHIITILAVGIVSDWLRQAHIGINRIVQAAIRANDIPIQGRVAQLVIRDFAEVIGKAAQAKEVVHPIRAAQRAGQVGEIYQHHQQRLVAALGDWVGERVGGWRLPWRNRRHAAGRGRSAQDSGK